MSNSRVSILQRVRQHQPTAEPLTDLKHDWVRYDDAQAKFIEMLESVGGQAVNVASISGANTEIVKLIKRRDAGVVCNLVEGIDIAETEAEFVDLSQIDDAHDLANIDLAILSVHFGVAENGAVWLQEPRLNHRVLPFLTQHLALVLPTSQIVHNMHEAYERMSFSEPTFGVFVSGPSKTADIEQSLVIGAHGARSLTILLTS